MQLLTVYQECFDDEFKAHEDSGSVKIICQNCQEEAVVETGPTEKQVYCDCGVDWRYTCSLEFWSGMEAYATALAS